MDKGLASEGCIDKGFPLSIDPFPAKEKLQKGTSTRGLHDRTLPRAGGAHFAGAPAKLCIYDNLIFLNDVPFGQFG